MSFAGASRLRPVPGPNQQKIYAMYSIQDRADKIWATLWWKFASGPTIEVKWPNGWVVLHENADGTRVCADSADPNDHYRPWLEENVGKQGRDWDWRPGSVVTCNGSGTVGVDTVAIKFRKGKASFASMAALKWN
jgi:hypothetical protein